MLPRLSLMETEITSSSAAVVTAVNTAREDASAGMAHVSDDITTRLDALEVSMSTQNERLHGELRTLVGYMSRAYYVPMANGTLISRPRIQQHYLRSALVFPGSRFSRGTFVTASIQPHVET